VFEMRDMTMDNVQSCECHEPKLFASGLSRSVLMQCDMFRLNVGVAGLMEAVALRQRGNAFPQQRMPDSWKLTRF
jgi:hypothetical protein